MVRIYVDFVLACSSASSSELVAQSVFAVRGWPVLHCDFRHLRRGIRQLHEVQIPTNVKIFPHI